MSGFKVRVVGMKALDNRLQAIERSTPREFGEALIEEALMIFADSQELVPVDTGRLRASGVVADEKTFSGQTKAMIAYGTDYGLIVHEKQEVHHVVGEAKFLEKPFLEAQEGMVGRIEQRVAMKVIR